VLFRCQVGNLLINRMNAEALITNWTVAIEKTDRNAIAGLQARKVASDKEFDEIVKDSQKHEIEEGGGGGGRENETNKTKTRTERKKEEKTMIRKGSHKRGRGMRMKRRRRNSIAE